MPVRPTRTAPPSRARMRVFAAIAVPLSLVILVTGLVFRSQGRPNSTALVVLGAVLLAVWALIIPLARRRGRL
jgi:Zn-dependent membrane protease YugP